MSLTSRLVNSKIIKNGLILGALTVASLPATSCVTISRQDKAMIRELEMYGVNPQERKEVEPVLAGFLNLGPGLGNFYLGFSGDEPTQHIVGAINLLLWYPSVVWGIPEAIVDGIRINKKATAYYYTEGPGRFILDKLREDYRKKFLPKQTEKVVE